MKRLMILAALFAGVASQAHAQATMSPDPYPLDPVAARTAILDSEVSGPAVKALATELQRLAALDHDRPIDLVIDSPGGSVFAGNVLISAMEELKDAGTEIRCWVPHLAASMAFQIYLHCSERHALSHSYLLFHRARFGYMGLVLAPIARDWARDLQATDDQIIAELRDRMPMDEKDFWYHYEHETLHTAPGLREITGAGFLKVDEVVPGLLKMLADQKSKIMRTSTFVLPGLGDESEQGIRYEAPWVTEERLSHSKE